MSRVLIDLALLARTAQAMMDPVAALLAAQGRTVNRSELVLAGVRPPLIHVELPEHAPDGPPLAGHQWATALLLVHVAEQTTDGCSALATRCVEALAGRDRHGQLPVMPPASGLALIDASIDPAVTWDVVDGIPTCQRLLRWTITTR